MASLSLSLFLLVGFVEGEHPEEALAEPALPLPREDYQYGGVVVRGERLDPHLSDARFAGGVSGRRLRDRL